MDFGKILLRMRVFERNPDDYLLTHECMNDIVTRLGTPEKKAEFRAALDAQSQRCKIDDASHQVSPTKKHKLESVDPAHTIEYWKNRCAVLEAELHQFRSVAATGNELVL